MEITARFDFDKVACDQDHQLHLLLTLRAPKVNWVEQRPKLAIMPVVDISSSMGFRDKLKYAKQSLIKMIDHLGSDDYCGLVTFGSEANVLSSPIPMTSENKASLKSMVEGLKAYGNTAFASGMTLALKELKQLNQNIISRVIMFTDGEANVGASKIEDILALLPENLGRASISAFGYGQDARQDLLNSLATEGKGNYAFIQSPDHAPAAFAKELGGLLSVFATDLKVTLKSKEGLILDQVISDVSASGQETNWELKIPELLSEEVRHLVIACRLPACAVAKTLEVLDIEVNLTTLHPVQELTRRTNAYLEIVVSGEHQDKPTKEVDDLVTLAQMIRAQMRANDFAAQNRFTEAEDCFATFARSATTKGQVKYAESAGKMRNLYQNRTTYDANTGYLSSFQKLGTRAVGASSVAPEALDEVKTLFAIGAAGSSNIELQFNNSAQDDLLKKFEENDK